MNFVRPHSTGWLNDGQFALFMTIAVHQTPLKEPEFTMGRFYQTDNRLMQFLQAL